MRKIIFVLGMMLSIVVNGQWSEVGGKNTSKFNDRIDAVVADTNGNLYAAGFFKNANNKCFIAKWNGTAWSELGGAGNSNFNSGISALAVDGNQNVYAGGSFTNSNGNYYVAKWNGTAWSELGGFDAAAFNADIYALKINYNGDIIVTGAFVNLSGNRYMAKYNGTSWGEVSGSNSFMGGASTSICFDKNNNIYTNPFRSRVAIYDGTSWTDLGGGGSINIVPNYTVEVEDIYADKANNVYAKCILVSNLVASTQKYATLKYDGTFWSVLTPPYTLFSNGGTQKGIYCDSFNNVYVGYHDYISSPPATQETLHKWNGSNWSDISGITVPTMCITGDKYNNIYACGDITNNAGYHYVAKYSQPLPLKLLSFTTKLQQNNIVLNWHTTNEINVSHFNIQRSVNVKDFENIGKVNATCCEYKFTDPITIQYSPLTYYYRLEIVDKDGSKTYSEIKQIRLNELTDKHINIYPNPATTTVTIECAGAKEISIIDYLGKIVYQSNSNRTSYIVNLTSNTKGIYIVKATMNNSEIKTEKLVIE